ncbi:MAG: ABC transporter ATP-binding protein [Geminicoccaceae bacterium]
MARLVLDQICKGYAHPVLDRLSLTVDEGEFFVIVGPSGIGKTTLLRCIAGLERLDGGRILFGDDDVTNRPPYQRGAAMTFESYALYPHLSVAENVASPLRARGMARRAIDAQVRATTKLLRIDHLLARKPHEISGGQKQRTALARTLVARPKVFLLDEPISHLDAKIRHELRRQFHSLEELRKVATVYVTHDYAEALSLGDRIGVMGHGGLEQIGGPRDVFLRPRNLFVAEHLGQPTINTVPVHLEHRHGRLQARLKALPNTFLPVAEVHRAGLEDGDTRDVTLGIRPQHIKVTTADASSDGAALSALVDVYEALGAHGILLGSHEGLSLTAMTPPEAHFAHGQAVTLHLDPARFHYFAAADGRNLAL